jgi:hypothetical protein
MKKHLFIKAGAFLFGINQNTLLLSNLVEIMFYKLNVLQPSFR